MSSSTPKLPERTPAAPPDLQSDSDRIPGNRAPRLLFVEHFSEEPSPDPLQTPVLEAQPELVQVGSTLTGGQKPSPLDKIELWDARASWAVYRARKALEDLAGIGVAPLDLETDDLPEGINVYVAPLDWPRVLNLTGEAYEVVDFEGDTIHLRLPSKLRGLQVDFYVVIHEGEIPADAWSALVTRALAGGQ